MVTFIIIEKLQEEDIGFKNRYVTIASLFFADDGMILAQSLEETKTAANILTETASSCGLNINKQKSNIIIYNAKEEYPYKIEDIEVVECVKYLGVKITNKSKCFDEHKKENLLKAKGYANMTYSIIQTACNRVLMGKTYWKSIAMPMFLYASEILEYTEKEIEQLQRLHN